MDSQLYQLEKKVHVGQMIYFRWYNTISVFYFVWFGARPNGFHTNGFYFSAHKCELEKKMQFRVEAKRQSKRRRIRKKIMETNSFGYFSFGSFILSFSFSLVYSFALSLFSELIYFVAFRFSTFTVCLLAFQSNAQTIRSEYTHRKKHKNSETKSFYYAKYFYGFLPLGATTAVNE